MSIGPLVNATRPAPAERPSVARGRVVKAPASASDSMSVVLINYSNALEYEVVAGNWEPRGASLPKIGDACPVLFDDDGDAWVPVWAPG